MVVLKRVFVVCVDDGVVFRRRFNGLLRYTESQCFVRRYVHVFSPGACVGNDDFFFAFCRFRDEYFLFIAFW